MRGCFTFISSTIFAPSAETEAVNGASATHLVIVIRGVYASLASFIAASTVGLLVALVGMGSMRDCASGTSLPRRSASWA